MNYLTGYHAIEEAIKSDSSKSIVYISKKNNRINDILREAGKKNIPVKRVNEHELERMSGTQEHRGCVLQTGNHEKGSRLTFEEYLNGDLEENELVFLLDGVTDPQNLGAIIRSADLFGVSHLVLPGRRTAQINETVARTSAGASAYLPCSTVTNLAHAIRSLKKADFWVYTADMGGTDCSKLNLKGRCAIVMGSEGNGPGKGLKELADADISIPIQGHIDSLNVSVAAGILMYEIRKQAGF